MSKLLSMLYKSYKIPKWGLIVFPLIHSFFLYSQPFDAVLVKQQTTLEIVNNKLIQTHFFQILINNRKGDIYSEVSIPYNKINEVSDIQATILDDKGNVVKNLKKSDITQRSAESDINFYSDTFVKEFAMRNQSYPYTIQYSYREEAAQFIFLTDWMPVINYDIPTIQATLKLSIPENYKIFHRSNKVKNLEVDSVAGRIYYTWNASYTDIISPEFWSPAIQQFMPFVEVVPEQFRYGNEGSNSSWKAYGNWNIGLINGLNELPDYEKLKIHSLTDSLKDNKEKIRVLFHFLQDATRYISVSIKTGGMIPFSATYVAEKKYGDCKALTNYFKSCLSVIGIESFYTIIHAGEIIDPIDSGFPSQQFNHVILLVPLNQDTLWLDCTSDLAFGYLGTFTQNRNALVLKLNDSKLITSPALTFEDVQENRKIKAYVNSDNSIHCEFDEIYKGHKYEILSGIMSEFNESERKQYIARYIVESGFQMEKYSIALPDRDIPEVKLAYSALNEQSIKIYDDELMLKIIPMQYNSLEDPKRRKLPVQINYPINKVDSIEYLIPERFRIADIPKNTMISSVYGEYIAEFHLEGNRVLAIKQLTIKPGTINIEEYPAFYKFRNTILETENSFYLILAKK